MWREKKFQVAPTLEARGLWVDCFDFRSNRLLPPGLFIDRTGSDDFVYDSILDWLESKKSFENRTPTDIAEFN